MRYGLSEDFEISALVNLRKDIHSFPSGGDKEGISDLHLGFRCNLIGRPEGLLPAFGIQTRFATTHQSSDYRTDHLAPEIIFVTTHNLAKDVDWGHNLVISYDGITPIPPYLMTSNVSFPITKSLDSFFEVYGDLKDGYGRLFADTGFAYLVNKDLQLDTYFGWGHNHGVADTFISIGVSWRAQTRTKNLTLVRR